MLKTVHQQFKTALIERRKVSKERAAILADGRVYAGQDALAEELVDELGGVYDAIKYAGRYQGLQIHRSFIQIEELKIGFSLRAMMSSYGLGNYSLSGIQWMN